MGSIQISQKTEVIQDILQILTIFSIEISKGKLQPQKIHSIRSTFNNKILDPIPSQGINNKNPNEPNKDSDKENILVVFENMELNLAFL